MNWVALTSAGATLNALTNLGYRLLADANGIFVFTAMIFTVSTILLFCFGRWRFGRFASYLLTDRMVLLVLFMGFLTASIMVLFLNAFKHGGPISLVDPLFACMYALTSVFLGVLLLKERPS